MTILGTLELDLSAPTGTLAADLRRADEMIRASSKAWAESGKVNWGIAASLHTEMRAARSIFNSSMKAMESDAKGYRIEIDLDFGKQIAKLNKQKIVPQVDDSQLTALNAHLSLKEQHLNRVIGKFDSSKITPQVDDRGLRDLDFSSRGSKFKVEIDDRGLSESIGKSVKEGMASAKSGITGIPKTVLTGFYEGIGQTYAKKIAGGAIAGIEEQFSASFDRIGKGIGTRSAAVGQAIGGRLLVKAGVKGGVEELKGKIDTANEVFTDLFPADVLDRKLQRIENRIFKIFDNATRFRSFEEQARNAGGLVGDIAGLAEVPQEGMKRRRRNKQNSYAQEIKNAAPMELPDIGEDVDTIVLASGGYAGMGGKSSGMVSKKLGRLLGEGYQVVPVDNVNTDVSMPLQDAGVTRWLAEAGGKIAAHNVVDGINPDAITMATLAYQLQQKYPNKKIRMAGFSAGGMVASDAVDLSRSMGMQTEGVAIGTPHWGRNAKTNSTQFGSVLREEDGVTKISRWIEQILGVGLDRRKTTMTPGAGHDLSLYLSEPQAQRTILDRLGSKNEPMRDNMLTPEAFRVIGHQSDAEDIVSSLQSQLANPIKDPSVAKAMLGQTLGAVKEIRGNLQQSFDELPAMQSELSEYLEALQEAEELILSILKPQKNGTPTAPQVEKPQQPANNNPASAKTPPNTTQPVQPPKSPPPAPVQLPVQPPSPEPVVVAAPVVKSESAGAQASQPLKLNLTQNQQEMRAAIEYASTVMDEPDELRKTAETISKKFSAEYDEFKKKLTEAKKTGDYEPVISSLKFITDMQESGVDDADKLLGIIDEKKKGLGRLSSERGQYEKARKSIQAYKNNLNRYTTLLPEFVEKNLDTQQQSELGTTLKRRGVMSKAVAGGGSALAVLATVLGAGGAQAVTIGGGLAGAGGLAGLLSIAAPVGLFGASAVAGFAGFKALSKLYDKSKPSQADLNYRSIYEEVAKASGVKLGSQNITDIAQGNEPGVNLIPGNLAPMSAKYNAARAVQQAKVNSPLGWIWPKMAKAVFGTEMDAYAFEEIQGSKIINNVAGNNSAEIASAQEQSAMYAKAIKKAKKKGVSTNTLDRLFAEKEKFDRFIDQQKSQLPEEQVEKIGSGIGRIKNAALGLGVSWATLSLGVPAMVSLGKATLDTASSFEQLQLKLQASTGSLAAGKQRFAEVRNEARNLGISQRGALETASRISATTFGTELEGLPSDIFTSQINQISQARGLSGQQQGSLSLALSQILGKPRVSAEEINQLVESGGMPDARTIAARSMGYTPQQFTKMMESGTGIDSKRFASAFLSQATSDSLLVKDETLDTQAAKLSRLNSNIEDLQVTVGAGFNPAFKAGLDLLSGSVKLLNAGVESGSKILAGAAIYAIGKATIALYSMSAAAIANGTAMTIASRSWAGLAAAAPAVGKFLGYAAAFYLIGEGITVLGRKWTNAGAEIDAGSNKILEAMKKVNKGSENLDLPTGTGEIWSKDGNWLENTGLWAQRGLSAGFNGSIGKVTGIRAIDDKEQEQIERDEAYQRATDRSTQAEQEVQAGIAKAKELADLDLQLGRIATKRSGLFAAGNTDPSAIAAIDKEYRSVYADRTKKSQEVAGYQSIAQETVNYWKGEKDKLSDRVKNKQVTAEQYEKEYGTIRINLESAENWQRKLNAAIKSGLDDLTPWTRQLDRIVAKFDDIRTNAELASSELSIERSLGQISGKYTKGQGEYKRDRDNENSILSQIKEKERTVKELRSFLNIKDPEAVKNVQKAYGVDDKTTAAQLKLTAETATGMDKEILSKMAVLKEQAADITGLYDKFAAARTEAMYRIEAEHREMVQYYVGISRQVDPQDAKYSKLISDIQQNKNKMLMKLGGYSSSMFDGWFSAFFDLLEAPKRKLEAQAQAAREMKAAIERWQDTNLDIDTRARSRYVPVDGGTPGIQQGDRSSSTSPQSPNGQSVPQQGQLAQGMSKWAQQEQGKAGQGGKSGQVIVQQDNGANSNDLLQRSSEANDARFRQEQERIVQGLTNTLWDEEVKKYQKETELETRQREIKLQSLKDQRAETKRQRDQIVPVTIAQKQKKERDDMIWAQEDARIDRQAKLQKYTDDQGRLYGLRSQLQKSKGATPEDEQARLQGIDRINNALEIAKRNLKDWKQLTDSAPKVDKEALQKLEEQQKYDRDLNTEQQEQNKRGLKKSKLEGERSRIAQQMSLRPFNRDLSKRDRELDFEITNLQIESDKVSQLRQITNDKREGKLTSVQADERTKIIKDNAEKSKKNAIEKQSQSSQQEANKYDAEERQLVIKSRSEILEQMGLNVRLQTASDKIDSPFANNKGLDLQRLLDLAKIENEKLVKLNELEEARVKYKDDDQGFLSKAEANYKTAIANLGLQKQAIESEYSGSIADRSKERKGYVFNQNQSEYRVFLDSYKMQSDGMKYLGQDTRDKDYEYQYNQKQTDYLQRRFDLQQQRDGIKGMSEEAINSRAQIDRVIEGLNRLEATDLSNLGAQFDRLNEVLLQTQKATRDVFGEFAFKGRFDWRKILRAPLESIANQALDKAVPDLFAGLYSKGEPPSSAKNNPQEIYAKRATLNPEPVLPPPPPRSNADEYITSSIERPIQSEPVQPSIPVYTKRATSTPEPSTSVQLPQPSSSRYVAQPIDPPRDPEPPPMRAEAPQPSTSAYTKRATSNLEPILPPPPAPPTKSEINEFDFTAPVIDFFNNPDGSIGQRSNESYTKRATSIPVPTIPIPQPPTQSQIIPVDYRAIGTKAPKIPQGLQRLGKQGQLVKLPSAPSVKSEKPIEQSYEAGSDLLGFMDGVRSKNYFSTIASGFNILRGLKLFSNGGKVEPDDRFQQLRSGNNPIAAALQKEGSNSIVAALTPGERVLSLRETRVYESMFPKGIQGYKDGGIAGGLKPVPMNLDRSRIESSNSNNVSFNIDNRGNVEGKGNERGMMKELEHVVTAVMLKHKRGKTGLI